VRVDPADGEALIGSSAAEPMVMRGRTMTGWLRVEAAAVESPADLRAWVSRGVAHARSLPPKP
jgi:hypothetical protein